jgi:DNA-binding winged helix-turn-helix (wHTH) protein/Tfp pilus assembly protein PilF
LFLKAQQWTFKGVSKSMSAAADKSMSVTSKFRFGAFEVDLENRELRKHGLRVRLQHKPFQILEMLLCAPGRLVMRDELARRLWPALHVNFDRSLNTAVNALRQVLGDSRQHPRYIETRSGLGYRFIAPVEEFAMQAERQAAHSPVPAAPESLVRTGTTAYPEAYGDYLKGRYFYNKLTEDDLHKSVAYFESALAQDKGCALAYAGLADTYSMFALLNMLPAREAYPRAKEMALAALRTDPDLGEAHAALAVVKRLFEWDWTGARAEHLRAVELSCDCSPARQAYGAYLAAAGKPEEAWREFERAREIDPLSLAVNVEIAWGLYLAGDFTRAAEHAWRALAMEPKFGAAQYTLALAYEQMGMTEEAIVELDNARACAGNQPAVMAALAHVYSTARKSLEAAETLQSLHDLSRQRYVSPYWYGIVYAGAGDCDAALSWLEKACDERDVWLTWLKVEPRFECLRTHARFRGLCVTLSS